LRKRQGRKRRRERGPHLRCSKEIMWQPGWVWPHVYDVDLWIVEEWPGGVAPALAGSRCNGVVAAPTTSAGGVRGRGPLKGAGEDEHQNCWAGVGEGRCNYPPETARVVVEPKMALASRVSCSRRRSLWIGRREMIEPTSGMS
jgi:hypothetical protein